MFQFAFDGTLFRFDAKAPTIKPLLQLPPTRAASCVPFLFDCKFTNLRSGSPDVPVRPRRKFVEVRAETANQKTMKARTTDKGNFPCPKFIIQQIKSV